MQEYTMNTQHTHKTAVTCTEDDIEILDSLIDKRRIKNRSEALVTVFDEYRKLHPQAPLKHPSSETQAPPTNNKVLTKIQEIRKLNPKIIGTPNEKSMLKTLLLGQGITVTDDEINVALA
jgi:hypothetical protein